MSSPLPAAAPVADISTPTKGRDMSRLGPARDDGSVAEWVMLVVLAVGLVLAVGSVASPALRSLVESSLSKLAP